MDYKCVNGHDACDQMYPGPECPYCEKKDLMLFKLGKIYVDGQYVAFVDVNGYNCALRRDEVAHIVWRPGLKTSLYVDGDKEKDIIEVHTKQNKFLLTEADGDEFVSLVERIR